MCILQKKEREFKKIRKVFSKKYHSIGKALEKVFFRSGTPTALAIMVLAQQGFAS